MKSCFALRLVPPALALAAAIPFPAAALSLTPEKACTLLQAKRLAARGGYRDVGGGAYRCTSQRRPLNAGGAAQHEIRFFATGDQDKVLEVGLALEIHSREDVQRAYRILADYATALVQSAGGSKLPPAVEEAILAGTSGSWNEDGEEFELRRDTAGAAVHELRLIIR